MDEKIEKIAQRVYDQNNNQNRFNVSNTTFHTHNGIDSQKIKQENIVNGMTAIIGSLESVTSEIFTLQTIPNINNILLYGFAANNVSAPATKRAIINGNAILGNCFTYNFTTATNVSFIPTSSGTIKPFLQVCNSMYVDSADLTHNKVSAADSHLIYVVDETSSVVAQMDIIKWTGSQITFQVTLASGWEITYYLSMS